jgi:mRNA-degrading endonuclease toxin of MazEF toxin-antitoxin module
MKIFGPYKGSKQNGGRPIYVFKRKKKNGTTVTTSSNKARVDYEKATGKTLPRSTEVDHKDNGGRAGRDSQSNLQEISKSDNVAKENKRRAGKKAVAKKAPAKRTAVKKTTKKAVKKKP